MVDKREILINGRLYEVADIEHYVKHQDAYLNGYTAVDIGQDMIYPVIPSTSTDAGIVIRRNAPFNYVRRPDENNAVQYNRSNMIDYRDAANYKEFAEKQNMVRELEKDILTSPDNIYVPPEDPDDSPAMKALKQAVIAKHIDLDKYEPRFGSNYNNDKRIFNKPNISLPMIVRIANALDIKASLTLEDQTTDSGDTVPNPMGNSITVELTSKQNFDE